MSGDPMTEPPEDVEARANRAFEVGLMRLEIDEADRAFLRRTVKPTFAGFCKAMQAERIAGEDQPRRKYGAALLMIENVFWETVCVTEPRERWPQVQETFLASVVAAIREGPSR